MLHLKEVAAFLDAVTNLVDLEQEQHVVLVNLLVMSSHELDDLVVGALWVVLVGGLLLLAVEHVLEKSVVQVDLRQVRLI